MSSLLNQEEVLFALPSSTKNQPVQTKMSIYFPSVMPISKYKLAWTSIVVMSHLPSIQPLSQDRLAQLKGLWG